ncbi:hypothetical protein CJF30_00001208 [Rutstroemia sp. NJR-2017a BBW]|nr:hypothetical protein CJF30_00001208 [Rutstroemia sp. NJR-2017a BBW]
MPRQRTGLSLNNALASRNYTALAGELSAYILPTLGSLCRRLKPPTDAKPHDIITSANHVAVDHELSPKSSAIPYAMSLII